jgi:RNA recognition motif-containing protein
MTTASRRRSSFDGSWADLLLTPPGYSVSPPDQLCRTPSVIALLPTGICDEDGTPVIPPTKMEDVADFNFQFPGELEDRAIVISHLQPGTTAEDLRTAASAFGEVDIVELKDNGLVGTVRFFDLRSAMSMRRDFRTVSSHRWILQFAPPQPITDRKRPPNSGTIVIFHLVEGITDEQLREELSRFGQIRQIRSPPDRKTQRFVEFWDLRHAAAALHGLRGRAILNSRVSVEFSIPGGYRKHPEMFQDARTPVVVRRTLVPCTIAH